MGGDFGVQGKEWTDACVEARLQASSIFGER